MAEHLDADPGGWEIGPASANDNTAVNAPADGVLGPLGDGFLRQPALSCFDLGRGSPALRQAE